MGLSAYLNNKTLKSNFSNVLAKYDTDNNGFTKKEFSSALKGITNIFAYQIVKLTSYDNKLFNQINSDQNEVISYDELANYLKSKYKLDFDSISKMTFKEICEEINKIEENNKSL